MFFNKEERMEKKDIDQMLSDFREDFELTFAEVAVISKPNDRDDYEERVIGMNRMRKEMKEVQKGITKVTGETKDISESMNKWLFHFNRDLKDTYFNLMVKGDFDKVIKNIKKLKEMLKDCKISILKK